MKVISIGDGTSSLLLISLRASVKIWFEHLDLATIVVAHGHFCKRSGQHQRALHHHKEKTINDPRTSSSSGVVVVRE